ncbi:MAG: DUF6246 family protein [Thalassolituus sp.]
MARLDSGEIGVIYDGREYVFRPSFRALDNLHQCVSVFDLWHSVQRNDVHAARLVMDACYVGANHSELNDLIGHTEGVAGICVERAGEIPDSELCVLAFALLRNGLQGREGVKTTGEQSETHRAPEFNALDYVWAAVDKDRLGLSWDEAWNLTMHEFMAGMMVKFPDKIYDKAKQDAEVDALMAKVGK